MSAFSRATHLSSCEGPYGLLSLKYLLPALLQRVGQLCSKIFYPSLFKAKLPSAIRRLPCWVAPPWLSCLGKIPRGFWPLVWTGAIISRTGAVSENSLQPPSLCSTFHPQLSLELLGTRGLSELHKLLSPGDAALEIWAKLRSKGKPGLLDWNSNSVAYQV